MVIQRVQEVLPFTRDDPSNGNEVTGAMFDAMLAELRSEAAAQQNSFDGHCRLAIEALTAGSLAMPHEQK